MSYQSLEDLEKNKVSHGSTRRIEYVIDSLNEAKELKNNLTWNLKVWENCTVEELIGGLIEAENLLRREKNQGGSK